MTIRAWPSGSNYLFKSDTIVVSKDAKHSTKTARFDHTFNHGQSRSPATYTDVIHAKYGRKISPGSNCGEQNFTKQKKYNLKSSPLDSCEGNAFCVDGLCVCAAGMQPSSDGKCERIETSIPSVSSKSTLETGASVYARPGQKCSSGEICTGGSYCSKEGLCMCSPEKPYLHGGKCSVKQYSKTAKLGELCDENTTCTEGSTCDKDTGICKCPPDHITSGQQCQLPSTFSTVIKPLTTSLPLPHLKLPTIDATFIEATSSTKRELGERPIPISYAKYKVEPLPSKFVADLENIHKLLSSTVNSVLAPFHKLPSPTVNSVLAPSTQASDPSRITDPPMQRKMGSRQIKH
ncbi:hypothetical protein DICVIV_12240 [Dictyocaulus viviparus]|uniref:EB domain-containing protein n=1 Tax=Dictyocaulus viviparus TaxID=29172 RepID=A0A0D8XB29_DICVI|nr:hypothetical protein DICVIV_12240 [Dictyocaulus viviparus]